MCGIFGLLSSEPVKAEKILQAISCMDSRGPDDEGFTALDSGKNFYGAKTPESVRKKLDRIIQSSITSCNWLAHKRLEITGGEESHQPMQFENLWIAFEGEIYNYRKIREELEEKGYSFRTSGDTEVFLKAYSEWQDEALEKFRGKWSAAIYNASDENIYCFTDRFGTKPLYFLQEKSKFCFSSEIKPILESGTVEAEENTEVVMDYLKYGLSDHRRETFFSDIKILRAGEKLVFNGKDVNISRWHSEFNSGSTGIRESADKSFERHIPDQKCAFTLSGGLDSTILASYAVSKDLDAEFYSISLPGTGEDERDLIEATEEKLGVKTNFIELSPIEIVQESRRSIENLEEPVPILPFQAQSLMFDEIERSKPKVVLQGSGSDEFFCGYSKFLPFYLTDTVDEEGFLEGVREFISYRKHMSSREVLETLSLLFPGGGFLKNWLRPFPSSIFSEEHSRTPSLYSCEDLDDAVENHLRDYWFPTITRCADKNSAPRGLEVRAAFLDSDLASTALEDLRKNFRDSEVKHRLREAFRDDVPDKILNRKEKQGFLTTDDRWLTPKVREEFLEYFESRSFHDRDLLESKKILRKFRNREIGFKLAYRLYQYEIWMQEFID